MVRAALLPLLLASPFLATTPRPQEEEPKHAAPARMEPTIANARLTEDDLAALADKDDDWVFEERLACRSSNAKKLWEGTLLDPALGKPARQEFQTIGVGADSDSILYFEFDGPVPPEWRRQLSQKLWSASGGPVFAQPELIGQAGSLVVVLSCSLTSKVRQPVGDRLRGRFGMRFPYRDVERRLLTDPLLTALENAAKAKAKPSATSLEFVEKNLAGIGALSFGNLLLGELRAANEEPALAIPFFRRAIELDAAGDPLPSEFAVVDAWDGIGKAGYDSKEWKPAMEGYRKAADFAASLGLAGRQAISLYNLACSAALGGEGDAAVAALKECFACSGRRFQSDARKDDDLKSLRDRPDWAELVK